VEAFVLDFFTTGLLPMRTNTTWITLVHKKTDVKELGDLRPIRMVGYLNKII